MRKAELNQDIKMVIASALIKQMDEMPFDDIKIVDITKNADIRRSSFYRNFQSKEEIIYYYFYNFLMGYRQHFRPDLKHITRYDSLVGIFSYVEKNKDNLRILMGQNVTDIVLDAFNMYLIDATKAYIVDPKTKYNLISFAGALYNCIRYWINGGCVEIFEEIIKLFYESLTFHN